MLQRSHLLVPDRSPAAAGESARDLVPAAGSRRHLPFRHGLPGILLLLAAASAVAGYKAKPWSVRTPDTYAAKLTSEGVTIAVEPLFSDALAAQVFDKKDMVTRGIMPLAVALFNDNDFPIRIEASFIELIVEQEHSHSLIPGEAAYRLFQKKSGSVWLPRPPSIPKGEVDADALRDFEQKFLGDKIIADHGTGGGFLFLRVPAPADVPGYLAKSKVYIPRIYRADTRSELMFFEIDLKPAMAGMPK